MKLLGCQGWDHCCLCYIFCLYEILYITFIYFSFHFSNIIVDTKDILFKNKILLVKIALSHTALNLHHQIINNQTRPDLQKWDELAFYVWLVWLVLPLFSLLLPNYITVSECLEEVILCSTLHLAFMALYNLYFMPATSLMAPVHNSKNLLFGVLAGLCLSACL